MTLFSDAITILANSVIQANGETVTYASGGDSASLTMVRGESEFEEYEAVGYGFTGHTIDWFIETADLILDATAQLPDQGDTITDASSNVYKVIRPTGDRCYRFTDATEKLLRIHTVRTA